jgi:hypothetical protein
MDYWVFAFLGLLRGGRATREEWESLPRLLNGGRPQEMEEMAQSPLVRRALAEGRVLYET